MKRIIICIIIGVVSLIIAYDLKREIPQKDKELSNIVSILDGKIDSRNEGKLVTVSGELEYELPIIDPVTGVIIPYFAATRSMEVFKHIKGTDQEFEWAPLPSDYFEERFHGVNGDVCESRYLIARSFIGDIEIDPRILTSINISEYWDDITEENIGAYPLNIFKDKLTGRAYLSESDYCPPPDKEYKGVSYAKYVDRYCYSYRVFKDQGPLLYTVIGIQNGNKIVPTENLDIYPLMEGVHTAEEFKKNSLDDLNKISIVFIALGSFFILLATFFIFLKLKSGNIK